MKYIVILALTLSTSNAFAGDTSGKITNILINSSRPNVAMLQVEGANSNTPSCQSGIWEYAIDISNETGKAMYSLALTSYAAGKTVFVHGTDSCTYTNSLENIGYLHTN